MASAEPTPDAPVPIQRPTPIHRFTDTLGQTHELRGFTYHTGEQYRTALNDLGRGLGVANWSFRVIEHGYDQDGDEMWVLGELTAILWLPDPGAPDELVPRTVVKQQFGGQNIKRSRSTGMALSLADDRKGAATDALKKCATELGFGLALSAKNPQGDLPYRRGEDDPDLRQRRPSPASNGTSGERKPTPLRREPAQPATEEEIDRYAAALYQAKELGFSASWAGQDPNEWTGPQLAGYRRQVDAYLTQQGTPT